MKLLFKLTGFLAKIIHYFNFIRNFPENNLEAGDVDARIQTLQPIWTKYQENDTFLQSWKTDEKNDLIYYTNPPNSLDSAEELFTISYGKLLSL